MFCCVRKYLHQEIWSIPSINNGTETGCFICLLHQLSNKSITSVQKQVALNIIVALFKDEDSQFLNTCRLNRSVGYQIIDAISELQADEPLQDGIVSVCVLTVDKLMKQDGYKHLLEKFIEGIHTVNETSIQFCMNVVSHLLSLSSVYVEMLIISCDDLLVPLLEKAEFMEETMTISLIQMLVPVIKHINSLTDGDSYGNLLTHLVPLVNTWLNTSQSLELKISILMLLKELSQHRDPILQLFSSGEAIDYEDNDNASLSQMLTPPDCPFLLGLKRMMTCKEPELTIHCVQCLTQVLQIVHEPQHIRRVMASDLPEFVFESLHTIDNRQLETTFSCLNMMVNQDDFFQRCHAVYGIDATINAVKEAVNNQRLSIAISGLHLLWCLFERQPETMPLLLNNSWTSCFQLIHQTLQNENKTIAISCLQATSSFLRPQHQQSPVDIQAILSLICTVTSKSQILLNQQDCLSASKSDTEIHTVIILSSLMDIFVCVISLFQLDMVFQGNDRQNVLELRDLLQSVTSDLVVSKKFFNVKRSPDIADKYIKCVQAAIFIHLFVTESGTGFQSSTTTASLEFFHLLLKSGLPLNILGLVSSVRCPSLEEQAAKLVLQIVSNCVESLPPALHFDPELFYVGLTQLDWIEVGLNVDCIPSDKNAVQTMMVILYFSYLYSYRPWPLDYMFYYFCEVFNHFPSYLSWHPLMLRSTIYFLAISEDMLHDSDIELKQNYEAVVIAELEKTSIDLWYSDCVEILSWTLSSYTRHTTVGRKTVEYWIHQLTLDEKIKDDMKTTTLYLKDCLPFYQTLIDLLGSNTAGKMASSVLLQTLHDDPTAVSKERILQWSHEKLEHLFSQTPDIDESAVDNILSVLYVLIVGKPFGSSISYLYNIKIVCQCAKYMTVQDSESSKTVNALLYLSALVKKFTLQESKIVIPPLIQNTKIIPRLQSALSQSNTTMLSHVLALCAWFSTHGTDFQAPNPLMITSKQILSLLASCKQMDATAVLRLVKSALISAHSRKKTSGAVVFVKSHQAYFSTQQIFNDTEIHQIYWYTLQYLVQDTLSEKQIAFDILEMLVTGNPEISSQCVHNPWNSLLMENIFTMKADAAITEVDLQLCKLPQIFFTDFDSCQHLTDLVYLQMSASDDMWTPTSANSFLLALTNSDLESLSIRDVQTIVFRLKEKTDLYDPFLMCEVEDKLKSEIHSLPDSAFKSN